MRVVIPRASFQRTCRSIRSLSHRHEEYNFSRDHATSLGDSGAKYGRNSYRESRSSLSRPCASRFRRIIPSYPSQPPRIRRTQFRAPSRSIYRAAHAKDAMHRDLVFGIALYLRGIFILRWIIRKKFLHIASNIYHVRYITMSRKLYKLEYSCS